MARHYKLLSFSLFYSTPRELSLSQYGVSLDSQETVETAGLVQGLGSRATINEVITKLEEVYCGSVAAEFQHIPVSILKINGIIYSTIYNSL